MLDVHTHFIADTLPPPDDHAAAEGWPVVRRDEQSATVLQRGRVVRVVPPGAWDPERRLADMDRLGARGHVVMPTPFTFLYDAAPDVAVRFTREQNDALSSFVSFAPDRMVGLGGLPLGSPDRAVDEVARIASLPGLVGVELGTYAGQRLLHDAELDPVFAALERHDLAIFVHPWKPVAPDRSSHHGLAFGLGRPVETELAVGSLLFGGVLDRHPGLRVCLAHGGAGVPALRGRLQNGWERQDPAGRFPTDPPRVALRRLWADGLTYDARVLALAEDTFGADKLVIGSDYPFAAQEPSLGASFAAAEQLLALGGDWRRRTHANAIDFLGRTGTRQISTVSCHATRPERTPHR